MSGTETFMGDVVMQVPHRARRVSAWIVLGDGVLPKLAVGAPDADAELVLHLANDRGDGPYVHAERVRGGMLCLDERPHQGSDQTLTVGGASVGRGRGIVPHEGEADVTRLDSQRDGPCYAWLVKRENAGWGVLVVDEDSDSFEIAGALEDHERGRFAVYPLRAGQMTLACEYAAPGWRLVVDEIASPGKSGPGVRH
jgi:hypothetical protein